MLNSHMFWDLVHIFTLAIELITIYMLFNTVSERKTSIKTNLISFILIIFMFFSFNIIKINISIRIGIFIISSSIFYIIKYRVSFIKSLIIPLLFTLILLGIEILSAGVIALINEVNFSFVMNYSMYRIEAIIISKSVAFICVLYFSYFKLSGEISKKDFVYVCIPVCTNIVILITVYCYAVDLSTNNKINNYIIVFISSLLMISSVFLIAIIYKILKDNKLKLEHKLIKEKISLECTYYMQVESNHEKVRSLYHDMKNHMICIGNLDTIEEVKKYVGNINLELNSMNNSFNTGNKIVDIILSDKKSICIKNNINFECFLDLSKLDFVDMNDICIIFSNAIDNAIQACQKIKTNSLKKFIFIKVTYVNSFCVINIENSKINKILSKKGNIITDKKDKFHHGLGIKNIKNIVNKYDGEVSIKFDDEKFLLTIMIPIKRGTFLH
ncbi:ATP-binding protein [Paraclostridium sordellii]|uniref:ATP-binding protein n=1 Tax=Paraclostridium sordellii TaxID=1505 RepID=UPI0005E9608F|nr:sensor histidine kinase [Paeniclostridium sordellii]CEO22414.1 sensor histidine kinase VirS [[Clostridium] sordellii] [Paeniclostridium sordellii]